jgi:TonB-linked SusC/RagA family outer membrane protein
MLVLALAGLGVPSWAAAQSGAAVVGQVTAQGGVPLPGASVFIESLALGAVTREDGRYRVEVPVTRLSAQPVRVTVRLLGYRPAAADVQLAAGGTVTQDFALEANPLRLGEVVVTGAGTSTTAEKLGNVRNTVDSSLIRRSNEVNIVQALAAKAPNVEVTASSGEPGASSFIRIRGTRTVTGNTQPLFVVDGVPIDNTTYSTSNFNPLDELGTGEISGTTQENRAIDINPDDIESIEILKGAAAGAIYGARAGQGVVLISTKSGRPGPTRWTLRSSLGLNDVSRDYPLQRSYGQGRAGVAPGANDCDDPNVNAALCTRSWGPALAGVTTYDHANEAYRTGQEWNNDLSISGGSERTSFFLSLGHLRNDGIFEGPKNSFGRSTVRLKGTHQVTNKLTLGGNFAYADTRGEFIQRGNNVNGLQLALLRSPPDFDNWPYLDPVTGLHRSYRMRNPPPGSETLSRGFDNPFFALYEPENTSNVSRTFGNVNAHLVPVGWLEMNYTLGADFSSDERLEGAPQASSDVSAGGRVTEGTISAYQIDHNLTATARRAFGENIEGSFTLGQNLNSRSTRIIATVGRQLVAPLPYRLSNTITRDPPLDSLAVIRGESYFGQATLDLWQQLYLTVAARNDGSSTFSENHRRNWFPKGSIAWDFSRFAPNQEWVTYGKLRAAYGETGQEPLPYLTSQVFSTAVLSGIAQGTGLTPTQAGLGGLASSLVKPATDLKPERTSELESGFDLGLWRDMADLSFTFYDATTRDVILLVALPPSSGYRSQAQNAAKFRNRGLELSLNVRPIMRDDFQWEIGGQWAQNRSEVLDLRGSDFVALDGVNTITPYGVAREGEPIGVFYDFGVVRCGISPEGMDATIPGVDLADACAGAPRGALYIGADGFPVADPNQRVVGDPNPDWTASLRSSMRWRQWQLSGLLDFRHGGVVYNGTKGALLSYGTHGDTEQRAEWDPGSGTYVGNEKVFGRDILPGPVVGPGANTAVPIGANWYRDGLAPCPFSNVSELCMEDGSYVKLREISVGYSMTEGVLNRVMGLSSIDLRLAGRNLYTWTDYTGYDPETNLGGAVQKTRGMDYFNMPQTRSFVLSLSLNR